MTCGRTANTNLAGPVAGRETDREREHPTHLHMRAYHIGHLPDRPNVCAVERLKSFCGKKTAVWLFSVLVPGTGLAEGEDGPPHALGLRCGGVGSMH